MLFAASSLAVLAAQALQPSRGSLTVTILCVTTIMVALLRTSLSFREVRALADAQRLARTDDLTGLPNLRQLLVQIDCVMSARGSAAQAAVLLIDLDRFKEVNDSFGHDVGDNLLRLISNRLEQAMPGGAMLARMGGDEFGVLLPSTDEAAAVQVAQEVCRQLAFPFALQGLRLHVEASAGIALAPAHGTSSSALLQHADVAMYESKRTRLSHVVFEPSKHGGARRRLETVEQFRAGLDSGELVLHYQPQLGLQSGAVVGFESLLRWLHPERGLLYPDQFLGLAEKAGLMDRVVDHVLKRALRDVQTWRQEFPGLTVAVNLSASNLQDAQFPALVMRHLHKVGLPPAVLTLEITENVLMVDAAQAQAVLAQLRRQGLWLSVDDYGTGYCSLGYLRELPVQELKLDRSFVSRVGTDPRSAAIVRSTIDLSRALGMQMVAEGVEDAEALRLLAEWGCEVAQGFHVARPMPTEAVIPWLRAAPHGSQLHGSVQRTIGV
jgi:diguanylate cyclase